MTVTVKSAAIAALALAVAAPALAHHSFAMFDRTKTGTVSGTVRAIEWTNPHIWLWVDVPDGKGGAAAWGFEGAAPGELVRMGWKRDAGVAKGDKVTVSFAPLRDGRNGGSLQKIVKADGTVIGTVGTPGGPGGPPPGAH